MQDAVPDLAIWIIGLMILPWLIYGFVNRPCNWQPPLPLTERARSAAGIQKTMARKACSYGAAKCAILIAPSPLS